MATRSASVIAGLALAGAIAGALLYDGTRADELSTICAPGYARARRAIPLSDYYRISQEAYRRAGIPWPNRHGYILDHRVPLCLGGTWDQSNLQIQTIADAAEKDRLEWRACREVCNGQLSIGAA